MAERLLSVTSRNLGDTARQVRLKKGYSVERVGEELDVDPAAVADFEKSGVLSSLEFAYEARGSMDDEADAEQSIERYFALLEPTDDDRDALRYDRRSAIRQAAQTVCDFLGIDRTSAGPRQAVDLWEEEPAKSTKPRERGARQISTLPATDTLGTASEAQAAPVVRLKLRS